MEPDGPFITTSIQAVEEKASNAISRIPEGFKKPLNFLLLAILVIVIWIGVTNPMVVTVTGNGEVSVPATNALVSFSLIRSDQGAPQNAISNVNAKALSMRTFLKSKGINDSEITESQVAAVPSELVTAGETGYQATITMSVKTSNIGTLSTLISDLYSQGAYVVSQPILSVDNQDKLNNQAFAAAMKDANNQAGYIGTSRLRFIRRIISVTPLSSENTATSTSSGESPVNQGSASYSNGIFKAVQSISVSYKMW